MFQMTRMRSFNKWTKLGSKNRNITFRDLEVKEMFEEFVDMNKRSVETIGRREHMNESRGRGWWRKFTTRHRVTACARIGLGFEGQHLRDIRLWVSWLLATIFI